MKNILYYLPTVWLVSVHVFVSSFGFLHTGPIVYFFSFLVFSKGDDEKSEHLHSHHVQLAQQFFPSSICNSVLPIVYLLEDLEVNGDGIAGKSLEVEL